MGALVGLGIAALLWWGLKAFANADPAAIRRLPKLLGGMAALAVAALFLLRGQWEVALGVGGVAAWLLGWSAGPTDWLRTMRGGGKRPEAASRRRSAAIELEADPATGRVSGTVLAGALAGRRLDDLAWPQLRDLRAELLRSDLEGAGLVEAYLDRRLPGWREHAQADPNARGGPDAKRNPMSQQEAYEVLGLQPGAGTEAVQLAYRSLMKKLHPDHGGSTYLASRVNEAKDVLLNRHR